MEVGAGLSDFMRETGFGGCPLTGPLSWTLHLPDSMCAIHPVFHVSMLEPSTPNSIPDHTQPPPPPVLIYGEPEYEISEVLNSKLDNRLSGSYQVMLVSPDLADPRCIASRLFLPASISVVATLDPQIHSTQATSSSLLTILNHSTS